MDCPQHENGAGGEDEECCEGGSGCGSGDGETTTTTKITSTTTTEQYTCQDGSMIPITKVCNLCIILLAYSYFTLLFCFFDFTFLPY